MPARTEFCTLECLNKTGQSRANRKRQSGKGTPNSPGSVPESSSKNSRCNRARLGARASRAPSFYLAVSKSAEPRHCSENSNHFAGNRSVTCTLSARRETARTVMTYLSSALRYASFFLRHRYVPFFLSVNAPHASVTRPVPGRSVGCVLRQKGRNGLGTSWASWIGAGSFSGPARTARTGTRGLPSAPGSRPARGAGRGRGRVSSR